MLAGLRLDGWLLFDFHGMNPVATRMLGLGGLATRRLFVLLPAAGRPIAVAHRIEQHRIAGFPARCVPTRRGASWSRNSRVWWPASGWPSSTPRRTPCRISTAIPAGVVELLRASGAEVVSSSELVTALAARWSPEELANHLRAAELLREIALAAFSR